MKIFLDPRMVTAKHADQLRDRFPEIVFTQDSADAADVDAVMCHPGFAVRERLASMPKLRWIQILMAGYDAADLPYLHRRGIVVTNLRDVFHLSIAEDVVAKILFFNRGIRHDLEAMRDGRWEPQRHLPEIHGSTVGILGAGSIGTAIAIRLKAFGARILGYRRRPEPSAAFDAVFTGTDGLHRLLQESDVVVACLPLNVGTRGLIDASAFAQMKREALFINVGRGETVDQKALVDCLRERRIRGAGLDVMTPEPLPAEDPLWRLDNVFITPHNASSSPFLWPRIVAVIHENTGRFLAGEPLLNRVED